MSASNKIKTVVRPRTETSPSISTEFGVVELSKPQRISRAMKYLFGFWIAAALCVLIPVMHFVLVPLGILLGIFAAARNFGFRNFREAAAIHCPVCKNELHLQAAAFNWPMRELCSKCRTGLVVEKLEPAT